MMILKPVSKLLFSLFILTTIISYQPQAVQASTAMLSSQDIKTYCFSDYDIDVGYCAGYITAVADLMVEHRIYGFEACYMELKSPQAMVQKVRGYIRKDPSIIRGNARYMIAHILAQLYPCY